MAGEISTIQSLKAVDAWIDVINANINGGVRTAFKSSRLKFSGSNVDVQHAGNATSLPLQFPEPGLTTANTVIDFTQGAITASTENTHLAIQGDGYFMVCDPGSRAANGYFTPNANTKVYLTRDGEFHTNADGHLVTSYGYYLIAAEPNGATPVGGNSRVIYNDLDNPGVVPATYVNAVRLSDYLKQSYTTDVSGVPYSGSPPVYGSLARVVSGQQSLKYATFGSTVFDMDYKWTAGVVSINPNLKLAMGMASNNTILNKSLEASNSSMTQSVPELSLAQKLFSALTKVLQTKQTNVDGVLNLVR